MADVSGKFLAVLRLVEKGKYFTINRPRQYGKTTMLFQIFDVLQHDGNYLPLSISFEGVGDLVFQDEVCFAKRFLIWLADEARFADTELADWIVRQSEQCDGFETLSKMITALVEKCGKKMVLLIDEVDKSSNNQLFLGFLGMLRNKYLVRQKSKTFHSVVLTGIHDVKSLKLKISPESERKLNSPWNIAADFEVDMNLQPAEIQPMLAEYAQDRSVLVDAPAVAERLFYYTSGYPFLVSKLCKIFDEKMLPEKTEKIWTTGDVDTAARQLIGENNTNFDERSKNLDNNAELYALTQTIAIEGKNYPFEPNDSVATLGLLYGIFAKRNGLAIHNRIYQEVIVNKMSFRMMRENTQLLDRYDARFQLPGNQLDTHGMLRKFQELMRTENSEKDRDFLERQGRLVFLAFLKPVLNGHGHAFKEP